MPAEDRQVKIQPKNVRFLPVRSFFGRNGLHFVGRLNSIQLLETALVIEGNLKTLGLWVIDLLFRQALSEWTTVTIPYSRIVRCKYSRNLLGAVALFLLVFLPTFLITALAIIGSSEPSAQEFLAIAIAGAVLLIPVSIVFLLLCYLFDVGPRATLVYRRPDGRLIQVCFRIRPRALRTMFLERLEANRKSAGDAGSATELAPVGGRST